MRMRTIILFVAMAFAVLLAMPSKITAQDSCPHPVYTTLACDDGRGCKQTWPILQCAGPSSSSKCQYGPLYTMCCGEKFPNAEQAGPCDGNGGPSGAFLKDLKNQPISVQARVYVPSCRGSFMPAIPI